MGITRHLREKCKYARAEIRSGSGFPITIKHGTIAFYTEKPRHYHDEYLHMHSVSLNEEQFRQIYEDLKRYFEKKEED